jgi:hypothetical protein
MMMVPFSILFLLILTLIKKWIRDIHRDDVVATYSIITGIILYQQNSIIILKK